jgi:beta-hydroxylase
MGKITASPNSDTDAEKTGFINRLFALSQRRRKHDNTFKRNHRRLYKTGKYIGICVLLWVLIAAPWPFLR